MTGGGAAVEVPWGRVLKYVFVLFLATLVAGFAGAEAGAALFGQPDPVWPRAAAIGAATAAVFAALVYRTGGGLGRVVLVALVVALLAWAAPYRFGVWFFLGPPGAPWQSAEFLLAAGMALGSGVSAGLRALRA